MELALLHLRHLPNAQRHALLAHDEPAQQRDALHWRGEHLAVQRQLHRHPLPALHHSAPHTHTPHSLRLLLQHLALCVDQRHHVLDHARHHAARNMHKHRQPLHHTTLALKTRSHPHARRLVHEDVRHKPIAAFHVTRRRHDQVPLSTTHSRQPASRDGRQVRVAHAQHHVVAQRRNLRLRVVHQHRYDDKNRPDSYSEWSRGVSTAGTPSASPRSDPRTRAESWRQRNHPHNRRDRRPLPSSPHRWCSAVLPPAPESPRCPECQSTISRSTRDISGRPRQSDSLPPNRSPERTYWRFPANETHSTFFRLKPRCFR